MQQEKGQKSIDDENERKGEDLQLKFHLV